MGSSKPTGADRAPRIRLLLQAESAQTSRTAWPSGEIYGTIVNAVLEDKDWRSEHLGLAQLKPRRRPEFEKHAMLTIKKLLHKQFKSKRIPKNEALERLKRFTGLTENQEVFGRMFGTDSRKGIDTSSIRRVLTNSKLFEILFSQEFMQRLYEQMLEDTRQDISINILSKNSVSC